MQEIAVNQNKIPSILKLHGDNIKDVQFSSRLVGSTFYPKAQEVLCFLKGVKSEDIILSFEREPDNPYDSNAVAINVSVNGAKKSVKVGHFPKEGAELLSYVLLHDKEYSVKVKNISLCGGEEDKKLVGMFFDFNIVKIA